jgi:hypothetical protein
MRGCLWYRLADDSVVAAHPDERPEGGVVLGPGILDDEGIALASEVMRGQLEFADARARAIRGRGGRQAR